MYVGRFAPSPTGPLHAGSMVAALASWLDARAHGGRWLVRIEDIDTPRCVPGAAETILQQLAACGLVPDEAPVRQSARGRLYERALIRLIGCGWAYACGCTRQDIATYWRDRGFGRERAAELVYPGTCRDGLSGKPARALRLRSEWWIHWDDRRLGPQAQNLGISVGDFVLKRADGLWAYQLAVVVDDAAQGVTDVVRGEDLADNTPRQIHLQKLLRLPTPRYLHTPLVLGADGTKLSKQNGARPIDAQQPLGVLQAAGEVLGLRIDAHEPAAWLAGAVRAWSQAHVAPASGGAGMMPPSAAAISNAIERRP